MKNLSFRVKITLWVAGVSAFIIAVTFAVLFAVNRTVLQKETRDGLTELIEENFDEIEFHLQPDPYKAAYGDQYIAYGEGYLEIDDDYLDVVNGVYSALYAENGDLLYGEDPLAEVRGQIPFDDAALQKCKHAGQRYYVYDRRLTGYRLDGLWLRGVVAEDEGAGSFNRVVRFSLFLLPGLFILSVLGGLFIAQRALRPIKEITKTAREIGQSGDLDKRIHLEGGDDELRRLADVLDDMIARLQKAFEKERRFTSDVSHELRTPMSVIMAQCELALDGPCDDEEYVEALTVIQRQGKKMSALIEDMLCFSRMERGEEAYPKTVLDFSALTEGVCSDMALLREKGITLRHEIEPGISIEGNRLLLTRMITNLLSNAYRYGREDGVIEVRLRGGAEITLSVADNGEGISSENLEKIFERFYRAETERSTPGTGLGLAMVKEIAQYHGGDVTARSKVGEGSVFTVTFPPVQDSGPDGVS